MISIIAALDAKTRAIGKDGKLLFSIPEDLKRFKKLTTGHKVIMGRKTWESLPSQFRPLPDRTNIVITRQDKYDAPGATVVSSLEQALEKADSEEVFVIGGGEIYKEALPLAERLYLTLVDSNLEGDTYFPEYDHLFTNEIEREEHFEGALPYTFVTLSSDEG